MSYNLSNLKELAYYHGWNDTSTGGENALTRFLNRTLLLLSTLGQWPEYHKRDGKVVMSPNNNSFVVTNSEGAAIENISQIGDVLRSEQFAPLTKITVEEWLLKTTTSAQTGTPTHYALRKYTDPNSSDAGSLWMEILLYPTSTAADTLYFPYRLSPKLLSATTDKTDSR